MKQSAIRIIATMLLFAFLLPCMFPTVIAAGNFSVRQPEPDQENDPNDPDAAKNISGYKLVTAHSGFHSLLPLFDRNKYRGITSSDSASLTLEHADGIGSLYLIFDLEYGTYSVTDNETGVRVTCGENRFLHEVLDMTALFGGPVRSVTLDFSDGPVRLVEIYAYTEGYLPGYVQQWEPAKEGQTDLILFSTHGDDDQLFFAGLLPYYCALDYEVLVVYMTDHRNLHSVRIHEMLNGLWAVGVRTYPVYGSFPDGFSESLDVAYDKLSRAGHTKEDLVGFVLEQIRRYKPQVTVGHDFGGEYNHGQHMVFADVLAAALAISNDPAQYPELAQEYGTWEVPKAYFHMYEKNPIVMDWDTPMEELNGMTPFQVTQLLGYPQHISQRESWVSNWINGRKFEIHNASQIETYSPCHYGLYHTTVGPDTGKNDMFENLIPYSLQSDPVPEETTPPETQPAPAEPAPTSPVADQPQQPVQDDTPLLIPIIAATALILIIAVVILFQTRKHKHPD